jgi:hypothetical protein
MVPMGSWWKKVMRFVVGVQRITHFFPLYDTRLVRQRQSISFFLVFFSSGQMNGLDGSVRQGFVVC